MQFWRSAPCDATDDTGISLMNPLKTHTYIYTEGPKNVQLEAKTTFTSSRRAKYVFIWNSKEVFFSSSFEKRFQKVLALIFVGHFSFQSNLLLFFYTFYFPLFAHGSPCLPHVSESDSCCRWLRFAPRPLRFLASAPWEQLASRTEIRLLVNGH